MIKTELVRLKKNQGEEKTTELIELLYSAADVIGVPLLTDETSHWKRAEKAYPLHPRSSKCGSAHHYWIPHKG